MGDLDVTGSGTGGSVSDASSRQLPQTITDGWKVAVDAAKAETNGWSSAPHPTWPGDDGTRHSSGPSTGASASTDKLSSFERASSCMRLAGGGLQFLAGGFAFLNVEVPVAAQAVGIAAMAHGVSDMEIGSRQCFTGQRGDDSLFQKTVSAAAQTAGADPRTADRIGTATDIAAGFINPAGPITGAPGLVAQTANGARLAGQEVTAVSSLPSHVAGTSAVLHAAAAPAMMVGNGGGGEKTENDKSEDEKTKTGKEASEAKGETPKKSPDMTPIPGATEQEQAIDSYLRGLGHDVKPNPLEGQPGAGRQPDRIIDGTFTEYKSVSDIKKLDSDGLSAGLSRRIMDGRGQAPDIIVDTRDQPGMTRDIAERGVKRAYFSDIRRPGNSGNRLQSIRVIGNGFDFTIPRSKWSK